MEHKKRWNTKQKVEHKTKVEHITKGGTLNERWKTRRKVEYKAKGRTQKERWNTTKGVTQNVKNPNFQSQRADWIVEIKTRTPKCNCVKGKQKLSEVAAEGAYVEKYSEHRASAKIKGQALFSLKSLIESRRKRELKD